MADTVLTVPRKFSWPETVGLMAFICSGVAGAAYVNFEIGAIKERGVQVRARLDKIEADRDRVLRLEERLSGIQVMLDKIDRKLDAR